MKLTCNITEDIIHQLVCKIFSKIRNVKNVNSQEVFIIRTSCPGHIFQQWKKKLYHTQTKLLKLLTVTKTFHLKSRAKYSPPILIENKIKSILKFNDIEILQKISN